MEARNFPYRPRSERQIPERVQLAATMQEQFRALLKARGVSRAWLADKTGLSVHTMNQMFGKDYIYTTSGPSVDIILGLAQTPELPAEMLSVLERLLFLSPPSTRARKKGRNPNQEQEPRLREIEVSASENSQLLRAQQLKRKRLPACRP